METPPPPVLDTARQVRIESLTSSIPYRNPIINIVAVAVIAIVVFFLYKRYKDKQLTTRAHMLRPSPVISSPKVPETPIAAAEEVNEVKDD